MPLFFGDLLASTPTWDGEERALYVLLLAYQWSAGPLPNDTRRLAKMCQFDQPVFEKLWLQVKAKFVQTDAGLVNERLEQHRQKADQIAAKNADSGRAGAAARWRKDGERHSERHDERHSEQDSERQSFAMPSIPNQSIPNQTKPKKKEVGLTTNVRPDVLTVFAHWQSVHGHSDAKLSDKRKAIIGKALRDYSADQLCEAISGYQQSPFHMGENDRGMVYDSIELMLRDAAKIDAGLAFARNPPRQKTQADLRVSAMTQTIRDFVEGK